MANRIEKILKKQGRLKSWVGRQIGVSPAMMTQYCQNTAQPSWAQLSKMAEILGVTIKDLKG